MTATSSDGLAWSTLAPIAIAPLSGEKLWNPAVLRHDDGRTWSREGPTHIEGLCGLLS